MGRGRMDCAGPVVTIIGKTCGPRSSLVEMLSAASKLDAEFVVHLRDLATLVSFRLSFTTKQYTPGPSG